MMIDTTPNPLTCIACCNADSDPVVNFPLVGISRIMCSFVTWPHKASCVTTSDTEFTLYVNLVICALLSNYSNA
jgi:hypothetical protein